GGGNDVVSLSGGTLGAVRIVTPSNGGDRVNVTGATISNLIVTAGNASVVVSGTQLGQATVMATGANAGVVLSGDTFSSDSGPANLNVATGGAANVTLA